MKITSLIKSKIFSIFSHKILFCSLLLIFASFSLFGVEYKTISSSSTLSWFDEDSWEDINDDGIGDIPDISGDTEVEIYLNADMEAKSSDENANAETVILEFNKSGTNAIHIYFNGHTFDVKNAIKVGSNTTQDGNSENAGNLYLHGSGKMYVEVVEFGKDGDEKSKTWYGIYPENKLFLKDEMEFYVNQHVSPYHCKAQIDNPEGTKFYLNASGMNLNWYNKCEITFANEPIPYGEQTFFKIIDKGGNPFDTGKTISFERNAGSTTIEYNYSVEILGTNATWTLGTQTLSNGGTYSVSIPGDSYNETKLEPKLSALGTLADGDGIIITFRTPDNIMDMCEIRYIKGELLWTGASSKDILDTGNWSYDEIFSEGVLKEAIIGSGAVNYPEIDGNVTVSKLTVKNGARITVAEGGVLTVNDSLIFEGNSKIDASVGTVVFTGTGTAENPSFEATYPEFSKFGTIEVATDTTFVTSSDLHITTSLTNNGTFTAGKVYFEPNGDTATIEPTETSISTNIGELICTSQKGKTLVIYGTISVDKIALSGVANQDNARLTVKTENQGTIYLGESCENAKFLDLSIDNLPKIEKGNAASQDEIYIKVSDSNIPDIQDYEQRVDFYDKGWRLSVPLDYTWTGAEGTDWFKSSNWLEHYVPCENSNVTIKVSTSDKYPTLTQNPENLSSLIIEEGASIDFAGKDVTATTITNQGKIDFAGSTVKTDSIANNGTIDFAGSTVNADSITNNGTVKLTGNETITGTITENGKVCYYKGTGNYPAKFVWGGEYKNLVIEDGFSGEMRGQDSGQFQTPAKIQVSDSLTFGENPPISEKVQQGDLFSLEGSSIKLSYEKDNSVNIEATGDHVYNWELAFSESVSIKSSTGTVLFLGTENSFEKGLTLDAPNSEFSNNGTFSSGNGAISITAKTFTNAEGKTISAKTGFTCEETETFTNAGTITASGVEIEATGNFKNEGSFTSKNGEISITSASFENTQSSEISAKSGKMTISATGDFTNSGNITAPEVEIGATGDFKNTGTVTAESGAISITAKTFTNAEGKTISAKTGFTSVLTDTFTNAGTITATGTFVVNQVVNFTNSSNITASGVEIEATGNFTNSGKIDSSNADIRIESASFTNDAEKEIFAKNMSIDSGAVTNAGLLTATGDLVVNATGDLTSQGKVEVGSELSIKSQNCTLENEISAGSIIFEVSSFESFGKINSTEKFNLTAKSIIISGKIEAQNGEFVTTVAEIVFEENSESTFSAGFDVTTATDFTNAGAITAYGIEIVATGNFTNSGNFISENGAISITSANFENAQSSELSAKSGKMTISATGDFTNSGTITASGVEIGATGIFTNSGNIDSSTGLLKITAKSITTSGEIKANSGDFESTETDILFTGNSKTTFTGKLVVTTATDFENKGTITAYEVEIVATGDFKNEGSFISENGEISITSASFENAQFSEISAKSGKMTISATGDFTNSGTITASGVEIGATGDFKNTGTIYSTAELLKITAKSITTSGEINAQSGELTSKVGDVVFAENSASTFIAGLTVTSAGNFENYGTITAYGIEIVATGDFTNSGKLISENGDIIITSANFENAQSSELSAKTGKMTITATSDFTNAGTITAAGTLVVNQVVNFTNSGNITALGVEIVATGDFKNEGIITSAGNLIVNPVEIFTNTGIEVDATGDFTNAGTITAAGKLVINQVETFTNTSKISALGVEIEATGGFSNSGTIDSSSELLKITAKSITTSGEIKANSGDFESTETDILFTGNSKTTFTGKLVVTTATDFENKGTITAYEVEIVATGDFKNEGSFISENGEINITSANFENAQSSELSAKFGKMTITATGDFTNAGTITATGTFVVNQVENFTNSSNITALGIEIEATGDFTNSGKIDSSTGLLKITAKSITTSGEIKANSGEFESTESDILFAENSENTFEAGIVVTSAANFENCGAITAYGVEIKATGNFKNEGSFISENGEISIKSANFENTQSSELSAKFGKMTITATGDFTNAGTITATGTFVVNQVENFTNSGNITAYGVEIDATGNFKNEGSFTSKNGDISIISASFENAQSSELSAKSGKMTISATGDFTNSGTITASGIEIVATGNFKNEGSFISENGEISIISASFENAQFSEISAKIGKITISATSDFTNAGTITATGTFVVNQVVNFTNTGNITAYGVEIKATGNFKNEGNFISENGDITITSASFENAQSSELSAKSGKMTISATGDFTNAGTITASGVEIVATGGFTNSGTIDSSSELLKITAKSITTSGEIKANSGEFISTESDILFAANSETTFEAGFTVTSAGNFENCGNITAYGVEIVATSDCTNAGNLISKNGDISIKSASFENASLSEIAANKDFVCNVTESFSNTGIITSASGKVDINTKSFINKNYNLETPAKIKTENGLINVTTSNFENSGDISAYLDFTCAEPEIFTNAGTITSETGKIDVKAQIMENPGSFFAINGKIDIFTELFETTKEIFGKNIDINSQSSIFAGLVKSGAGDIYISSDLLITHPVEFCLGGSLIIGTVENPKNLVISSLDKNQNATEVKFSQNDDLESIETKVIVSGYAIIFNGNVTLSTNIDIANDFVLLNGITSGENSIYRDSITEIDGLFAYNLFGRGDFDFIDFPSELPFSIEDNKLTTKTLSHEKYNTHFSIAEGKIISVGKNFYCNGVDLGLNTSAEWFLKIPGNDVATSAFAECYNASIKNCKVAANTNPEDYAWLSTENAKDETGNTNVAFSKAVLSSTEVSTISDNIIFIKFIDELNGKEIKIENSCNEISAWLENFRFNVSGQISEDNSGIQFTGVYANPECTESTDGKGDLSTFYLKYEIPTDGSIDYRWNTDAIGNSYGSEESTDSSGNYKKVIPNIAFERALNASYAGLRDEHKNRLVSVGTDDIGSNPLFTETKDKASPVLIAVTLGQEQHETDASSQHHYDSHNFIDWQFSEPVEFENYPKNGISQIDSVDTSANSENIQATATFGKITNQGNGFVVAGLGSFSSGKITTGSKTGLGEVNAFYRNFALDVDEKGSSYNPKIKPTRLRLSIAGYVEEENPINYKGEIYNNWLGFIDSKNITIPSGTFTMPSSISTSIIDKRGNRGEAMEQTVFVNDFLNRYDKEKTLYGTWDIESPVVSSYMKENLTTIEFEEVIPVDFSQSLSAQGLEIHFLDNSSYNQFEGYSNWKWRTKIGWLYKNESTEITLPLDNKGGSRMSFAENKTGGGLRLSSIIDSIEALSCKNLDLEKTITFTTDFSQSTTYEAFFGKSEDLAFDVPYLSLRFSELSKEFSLNNNYELLYSRHDSQGNPIGFITDLAGNLLYDFTVNSPDKNPPKIFLSIGAVHKDKLYIMFSKKLDWKDSNGNADEGKLRRIVKSLSIFDSKGNDTGLIDYKNGSRTKIVTETEKSTGIEISLTRSISYEELKNLYIGVNVFDSRDELIAGDGDKSKEDSISGEHGKFSMLYDLYENPASKDLKHCLSDFAVNALDVLYAYDGRVADEAILAQGVYGGNQWTVTNFTENKDNSSQIISDKDISIVSKIKDPSSLEKQDKFSMIADISPNLQSTGSDFEIYTTINPRLWFTDYIKFFSTDPNNSENIEKDNVGSISGKIENIVSGDKNQNITFVLPNHPKNENSLGWGAGNEIQFLFKVFDKDGNPLMVDGNQDGDFEDDVDHPLFAVRLKDENDLTSIDLWSLNIVDILRQKGGVTILNNVINPLNSEECAIEITIPKAGNLTVQVLTLDGNVVKVIQRGRVEEGTYYYKWNGKNISGDSVARGMYFIRVVGPNIEETRKVMIVW